MCSFAQVEHLERIAQVEHLERIAQVEHMENHQNDTKTRLPIRWDITDQEGTCFRQERGQDLSIALYRALSRSVQQLVYIISFQSPVQS